MQIITCKLYEQVALKTGPYIFTDSILAISLQIETLGQLQPSSLLNYY